jgi:uncharacterized protein YbjT (DUF2867 family)
VDNGSEAKENIVVVFGGTGFLGRRVVRHLRANDVSVRIASRHPDRGYDLFGRDDPKLRSIGANVHDDRSVADALGGAYGVVNAVSLNVEQGQETFQSVHVEAGRRIAARARQAGVQRLVFGLVKGRRAECKVEGVNECHPQRSRSSSRER